MVHLIAAGKQLFANLVPPLRRLLGINGCASVDDIVAILAGAGIPFLMNSAAKRQPGERHDR